MTYCRLELYDQAQKRLARALELEPRLAGVRLELANVSIRLQEWPEALAEINAFLEQNPRAPDRERVLEVRKQIEAVVLTLQLFLASEEVVLPGVRLFY